jgi:two-component system response regulator (stage 0 sporulation protein F)
VTSDGRRVLVADDDAEIRDLVAEYLGDHGFEVLHASNGLEALLCVKRERPQAVLLDLNMPRLGGLEALKRIRELAPATRVVVYSGALEPEVERQAKAAGAVAVFAKPGTLDDLRLALEAVTPGVTSPATPVGSGEPPPDRSPRTLRILLVDDDVGVSEVLSDFLSLQGAEAFPVTNATDALRLLAHGAPDAIFLDIDMPGLSGLDALPAIRALAPHAKVVMVSGMQDESVAKQAFARGALDYIVKPVDLTHLERTLETIRAMTAQGL